ncbi:hypothetical protein Gotri_011849 [Gossypium trilobum]|uniref:Uncharacterized protein n=1 Tax=Gossypium trilobum TaxID=34281 RepID=A0A7J9EV48_9ROSI|nr:hypothetical protein [Gossypium trilobum]
MMQSILQLFLMVYLVNLIRWSP